MSRRSADGGRARSARSRRKMPATLKQRCIPRQDYVFTEQAWLCKILHKTLDTAISPAYKPGDSGWLFFSHENSRSVLLTVSFRAGSCRSIRSAWRQMNPSVPAEQIPPGRASAAENRQPPDGTALDLPALQDAPKISVVIKSMKVPPNCTRVWELSAWRGPLNRHNLWTKFSCHLS